jgi:predicted Zn-dependent protease
MKDQVKLGKKAAEEIRKKEKVLPETDGRVKLIREVGARLVAQIPEKERGEKPWVYTFDVIQNKEINAFALPGGPVFFYTGLLDKVNTVDQIAGIIGHELTHVRKEHWARDYARSLEQNGLILIGGMLLGAGDLLMQGASLFETYGLALPRSRRAETEADRTGFEMMAAAGYNPQGMIDVFKMLHATVGKKAPPEFMSDHPEDKKRIQTLEAFLQKNPATYPPQTPIPPSARSPYRSALEIRGFMLGN